MAFITTAPATESQLQSPLVCLPAEIKHMIYNYCFIAEGPIIDPVFGFTRPADEAHPKLGLNVVQTCRRIHHETDRRPLFTQNTFRFTTVDRIRRFFSSLDPAYSAYVYDVEVDTRSFHVEHPSIAREWLHYLAWGSGTWGKTLGSLKMDAPGLKCLRLNFESWPRIPMIRAELWNLLRSMLLQVENLERVVVSGASKGRGMAMREPWSPVHFVGGGDVGSDDLVQRMWDAVSQVDELQKVIRWERRDGKLYLEVVSLSYLLEHVDKRWVGPYTRRTCTDVWPENGSCTWFAYQNQDSDITETTIKDINPSAAG